MEEEEQQRRTREHTVYYFDKISRSAGVPSQASYISHGAQYSSVQPVTYFRRIFGILVEFPRRIVVGKLVDVR